MGENFVILHEEIIDILVICFLERYVHVEQITLFVYVNFLCTDIVANIFPACGIP